MKKKSPKKFNLGFLNWVILPVLLSIVSVNYLLNNILDPRWDIASAQNNSVSNSQESRQNQPLPTFKPIKWQGEGLVTFWFDDAWASQYETALPILQKYQYPGTIAVPTGLVGYRSYMNWYQIKRAQHLGWEVTAHSRSHPCDETAQPIDDYKWEILGSKDDLESYGINQDIYVLPCGIYHPEMKELITSHFKSMRTVESGLNILPISDPYKLTIIEVNKASTLAQVKEQIASAKYSGSWIILTFHQISYEDSEFAITPEMFAEVVKAVNDQNMSVVVPSQVLNIK